MGIAVYPATIASGQSLSGTVDLGTGVLCGIHVPGAWTAAKISFQASVDDGVQAAFSVVKDTTGAELDYGNGTDTSSIFMSVSPLSVAGARYVKVRSGTAALPVVQVAARTVYLVVRG